jgi:3-oxosteroid 1-dehydrogenase
MPADSNDAPYVIKGDSLADLSKNIDEKLASIADKTGNVRLNSAFSKNLKSTITSFNKFARAGIDKDFSRGKAKYDTEWHPTFSPMNPDSPWPANNKPSITMHPFKGQGPYYAIILAAGALDTNGGPVIDHQARVMSRDDKPIPGLYGTGNCIASPSKEAYWGAGCPLALSMTFGYIAANAANKDVSGA